MNKHTNYIQAFLILFLISFVSLSCIKNSTGINDRNKKGLNKMQDIMLLATEDKFAEIIPDTLILPEYSNNTGIEIMEPAGYRGTEVSDYEHMFNEEWYDFYQDTISKKFYMDKAQLIVKRMYDDCLQDSTTFVYSERNSLLLINGLRSQYNPVITIPVEKNRIWVGEEYSFTYKERTYKLRGDGITKESNKAWMDGFDEPQRWDQVLNYKLYLSENGRNEEQLIIAIPCFNDTFVKILWIGDMDDDGKPDFIFDVSKHYESSEIVLFLSSKAVRNEIVRCVGFSFYNFDC